MVHFSELIYFTNPVMYSFMSSKDTLFFNIIKYFSASLQVVSETAERSLQERIESGEDLPVGTVDRNSQMVR